ncbi:T9SS type A sorting domain-containing protein [candidate division KSB1 bacterium]|nr:T9SS type A sorting domain-containing protein [candidate division KSB1 bacterium]
MICLLGLLLLSTICVAQPVEGPWVVMEVDTTESIGWPRAAMVDHSTVRLFWVHLPGQGSEVRTQLYDLAMRELVGTFEVVRTDSLAQKIHDCVAEGTDRWAVTVSNQPTVHSTRLLCIIGRAGGILSQQIDSSHESQVPWLSSYGYFLPHIAPRLGGGWLMSWIHYTCGGPYGECSNEVYLSAMGDSIEYRRQVLPPEYQLFGPEDCIPYSRTTDTSWVFIPIISHFVETTALLRSYPAADSTVLDTVCTFDCPIAWFSAASGFGVMHDGQMMLYSDGHGSGNVLYRLDTERNCDLLADLNHPEAPHRAILQPSFGFVGSWTRPSYVELARLSPYGDSRAPGVFYWRDSVHVITESDPVVLNDGRIFVVWTEREETHENSTRLLIAGINWDTPLSAGASRPVPVPVSPRLSAYPNPFNSEPRIEYELAHAAEVELEVHNTVGQRVATLVDGRVDAGRRAVTWTPTVATGIYFVMLRSGGSMETRKVLYLR